MGRYGRNKGLGKECNNKYRYQKHGKKSNQERNDK